MSQGAEEFLYQKVARQLDEQIQRGLYAIGDRLPSIRQLCSQERISVSSAMQALSMLETRGLVEAKPKSGYYVRRRRLDESALPQPSICKLKPRAVSVSDIVASVYRQVGDDRRVPLGAGVPSASMLPLDRLSRYMAHAVRDEPGLLARYGSAGGHPDFLRQLTLRFSRIGCRIPEDEMTITCGAMESLNLAIRAVTKAGDTVVVESPCYFGVLEILESLGLKALPIPSTCEEGLDLELLAEAIEKHPVKAVALVPTFSNPNGSCMSEENREKLMRLLEDYDLPLIEDDLYGDMHFHGERIRPVKSYDRDGRVLYCSSFSKSLSPGLRIGWVAAGRYAEQVRRLKQISSITSPLINQLCIARFLASGAMDRHLRGFRQSLHTQVTQVAECVLEAFPSGTAISRPRGGYFLWVQIPDGVDSLDLFHQAHDAGIHIAPGQIFCPYTDIRNRIRLNCAYPCDDRIRQGIQKLGSIIRSSQKKALRLSRKTLSMEIKGSCLGKV